MLPPVPRPRPLPLIAGGLALVLVDFRAESLDLLPDPVGWLLVAVGAMALELRLSAWLAGAAALLSGSDAFLPYHYRWVDPETNELVATCPTVQCAERIAFDPVTGWRLAAIAATVLIGGFAVMALLGGLRRRAVADGAGPAASRLSLLIWAVGVGWVAPPAVALGGAVAAADGAYDPIWNGNAEYAALIGCAVLGWLILELRLRSGAGWAIPQDRQLPSPWLQRQ